MKRIRISIILLIISAVVCTVQFIYVYNSSNNFIADIENIEENYRNKDYETALKMSSDTFNKWKRNAGLTNLFLYHDYVDEITSNMEQMAIYAAYRKDVEFFSVSSQLKKQIASLKDSEIPNIENII